MSKNHQPAPKRPGPRKGMVGATLPPAALAMVDGLVGTFLGNSRSELLRYIVVSWITDHYTEINMVTADYKRRAAGEAE